MPNNYGLDDIDKILDEYESEADILPVLNRDPIKWIEESRPFVEGRPRNFLVAPFWIDIYRDNQPNKFIMGGRQIYKSTYTTDVLAHETTSLPGTQVCYVTFDEISRSGFSRQKLQYGTFEANPTLKQYPRNYLGNVGEISLRNGSVIYATTDHNQYGHVEGKSLDHVMLDEAQYQDIEHFDRVTLTMTQTQGKVSVLGIGGESGSPYEELWLRSDQRVWVYDDDTWRDKLQFGLVKDHRGQEKHGLIEGEYLREVLRGHWEVTNPRATHWHGYWLPQHIFPKIPLTIESAINDYDVDPQYSIEWKRKHMSKSLYTSHVLGKFYKASRRPITREMIERCQVDYNYLRLLEPEQIGEIKDTYGNNVLICMGVDFGSGNPSQTVIAILIIWKIKDSDKVQASLNRVQLGLLEPRPGENQLDQAEYINWMFKTAKCDIGIGDLGYGANQVMLIQDGGASRKTGVLYSGVGTNKFYGARSIGDETKPLLEYIKKLDEHGETRESLKVDKTQMIQEWIDFLEEYVPHPNNPFEEEYQRTRFMIPNNPDSREELDHIYHDWTSLTRVDLPETLEEEEVNKKQKVKKLFSHPADSLVSCILALQCRKVRQGWNWIRTG